MSNEKELWKKFNERRKEPNIFKILGMMDGAENRNSNFLAWLLNPQETHKLGITFLEKFLKSVEINCNDLNLESVNICREKTCENGRPDIIIENKKFICIIEVKFGANVTKKQLQKYINAYNEKKCNKKCYYILLDIYENKKFIDLGFRTAVWKDNVLNSLKDVKSNNAYINQYISFLEEKFYIYENTDINPGNEEGLNKKIKELRRNVIKYLKAYLKIEKIYLQNRAQNPFSIEFHPKPDSEMYYFLEFTEEKICFKKYKNENLIKNRTIIDGDDYIDALYDIKINNDELLKKIAENV